MRDAPALEWGWEEEGGMFRLLVASQPVRSGWLGSTTLSAVAHGTLITAALMTTGRVATPVRELREAVTERVTYVVPRRIAVRTSPVPAPVKHAATTAAKKKKEPPLPDVAAIQAEIDQSLKDLDVPFDPDLTAMTLDWLAKPDALSIRGPTTTEVVMERTALTRPQDGIYSMENVEVSVEPKRGNPLPRYPSVLQDMGIEGSFIVRFIVDSTGKVPNDKISFPSSMHRLFADAVRVALQRSRYLPARVGGQPVTEQVTQEFRFEMRKR
jgi:TonB family protein